ncbi:hypothetical protein, partial [Roseateles chitosanitabidus]|uniref:hypothetical protein n=1 Tax=Roseateles chitosanitabidus TaxID=65048 RepID=UPI001C3F6B59
GTVLRAERDVGIESARDTAHRSDDRQHVTRGVMGAGGGITVGARDRHSGLDQVQEPAHGSRIGSVGGNVTIVAGRTLGADNPTGVTNLYSEKTIFLSCSSIVGQSRAKCPNIQLNVFCQAGNFLP